MSEGVPGDSANGSGGSSGGPGDSAGGQVERFREDVAAHGGYVYSTSDQLSCRLASARITDAIHAFARPRGRRVLDVGCGDGVYSLGLHEAGAAEVVGVDSLVDALEAARARCAGRDSIRFEQGDVYDLPLPTEPYDVVVLRSMVHHLDDPARAFASVCRVAREVVVCDPNGYNPVLKVIEKVSPYHVAHEEMSYAPRSFDRWFEACGARVVERRFAGLVPMFCPDAVASLCKTVEPWVEATPGLRAIACGQYVVRVRTAVA